MTSKQTNPTTRVLKGKAVLTVDAVIDVDGSRTYETYPSVKSCIGVYPGDAYAELSHFARSELVVPNQCKRMGIGDRWHIDVVFKLTYVLKTDRDGVADWDVSLEFLKAKTLRKSPWNKRRHGKYTRPITKEM